MVALTQTPALAQALALALATGLATFASAQRLDKPAAFFSPSRFDRTLEQMPSTSTRIVPWASSDIPQGCYDRIVVDESSPARDPTRFRAYTVYLGDCAQPWHVCREVDATPSVAEFVDRFARLPVGLRQELGDVVHFAGSSPGRTDHISIWLGGNNTLAFDAIGAVSLYGFSAGATYSLDAAGSLIMNSSSSSWLAAYNRDRAVASVWAQQGQVHNFAEYPSLILYDRFTRGKLQRDFGCRYKSIQNQMRHMARAADDAGRFLDFAGSRRCRIRFPLSPPVDPATGEVVGGAGGNSSATAGDARSGDIDVRHMAAGQKGAAPVVLSLG
jgi:hypothetical protein